VLETLRLRLCAPHFYPTTLCEEIGLTFSGIVSKTIQKLVGKLTLFQGISQVLSHRKTT
jgi:hypothetical protein